MNFKIAVTAVIRNEAPNIAEWIAYHAACGFDAIILFNNGSTDDSAARALALRDKIDIRLQHRKIFAVLLTAAKLC